MLRLLLVVLAIGIGSLYSLRSAFYALLFYLWIAYFRPEMWIWSDTLQGSGLSLYCGLYLVVSTVLRGNLRWIGASGSLLVLFCLHSLVSTLLSPASAYCWPFWVDFAKSTMIACLIIMLVTDDSKLRLTLIVICLSLGLEGAKQGIAQMVLNPNDRNMNIVAFLGDNNGVAVGMLMLTPVLFALAQTTTRFWARWGFRFLAIGTIFRALTTYSRGGLLAFAAMCTTYWLRSTRKLVTLFALAVLAFGALSLMPSQYWERMNTLKTTDEEQMDDSAASRMYFWRLGADMALANPVFGVGHNGYSRAFDRFDETGGKYGTTRAVHSSWFGVLADLGFPGLALFLVIFISSWFRCSAARREALARGDTNLATIAGALQTALVSFAVGGTFLSFHYVEMLWHFFALSIALRRIAAEVPEVTTEPAVAAAFQTTEPALI